MVSYSLRFWHIILISKKGEITKNLPKDNLAIFSLLLLKRDAPDVIIRQGCYPF